jgi:hypothetical protein
MTSRRRVLLSAVAAFGAACSDSVDALNFLTRRRDCEPGRERFLAALGLSDIDLSALLEHSATREQLAGALRDGAPKWQQLRSLATDRDLRATLRRWIAEDFKNGALTEVDGWRLASSEAIVLALVATRVLDHHHDE